MTAAEIQTELTALAEKWHDIVHGPADGPDVETESGLVPPLAKRLAALEALSEEYVTAAEAAKDAAEAALATLQAIIGEEIQQIQFIPATGILRLKTGGVWFKTFLEAE
jgi:anti-sigma factor ChrR (cupin superfamily)